jgi:hypothetical protein
VPGEALHVHFLCGKPLHLHLFLKRLGQGRTDAIGYDEVGKDSEFKQNIGKRGPFGKFGIVHKAFAARSFLLA